MPSQASAGSSFINVIPSGCVCARAASCILGAAWSSPIPQQHARNITVFHVNPAIYGVAPINMDTADALGDM